MGFKAPPSIMQKVMRFKALKYEEGGTLTIWGNPCSLIPLYIQIYFHKLAAKSRLGYMYTIKEGIAPESDTATLAILGNDPYKVYT